MTTSAAHAADRPGSSRGDAALVDAIVAAATVPTPTETDRTRACDTVYDVAGGDPDLLEQARIILQARLAHQSDDFAAGRGLRAVRGALDRTAPPEGPWRWVAGAKKRR